MGMNDIGALGDEWDMEAQGDIPAAPNDAVIEAGALNNLSASESEKLGIGAPDVERISKQVSVAEDSIPRDAMMGDEGFLPKELLDKIADAAQEVAAFLEANPQEAAPAPIYDYGDDFAPV